MEPLPQDAPIVVVCATRLPEEEFVSKTQTGRSLSALGGTSPVGVRLYSRNSRGLSEVYNDAIESTAANSAILVFMHDDCLVADFFWADRVRDGLAKFDVVGIAGNRRRTGRQPGWIMMDLNGKLDDYANLSGAIGQGHSVPPEKLDVFGPAGLECKLMDGVFFACRSDTLHRTGLRFDPVFDFHFYDLDFCRSAEKLNLRMGTIALSIVHASYGSLGESWHRAYLRYISKWIE